MNELARLSAKDAGALTEFVSKVRAFAGSNLVSLKLFGSKATGHDTRESDIDVLIVLEDASGDVKDRVSDLAFDVNLAYDVYISPHVIAQSVLEHPVWRITPFLRAVERDGILL